MALRLVRLARGQRDRSLWIALMGITFVVRLNHPGTPSKRQSREVGDGLGESPSRRRAIAFGDVQSGRVAPAAAIDRFDSLRSR